MEGEDIMGRDSWRYRQLEKERAAEKRMNPIWRAVGCLIIFGLAVGGYLFTNWFLGENARQGWIPIPTEIIRIPFAPWLPDGFILKFAVAIIFMVISYGLLGILYSIFFPLKPGEYDVPPITRKRR
jgi:hypothetical protein